MGQCVCMGAMMTCSMGVAPSTLMVLPQNRVLVAKRPQANIMDNKPMVNILPFGMCRSLANPAVAAATAAAFGILTPMPCLPITPAPWTPAKPTVMVGKFPAINNNSKLMCAYGGNIGITVAGQMQVQV